MARVIEKVWEMDDHICVVTFSHEMFHRCGYVAVQDDSPLRGLRYDSKELDEVSVHGGLTYSGRLDFVDEPHTWAFGFDCAHLGDMPDIAHGRKLFDDEDKARELKRLFNEFAFDELGFGSHVWTLDEVAAETATLSKQLTLIEKRL